jgi:hypothetical protein
LIWFNSSTLEILSIALMSNRRKEWESFCVEVFSQRMKEHQTLKYWRMAKVISLGMSPHPSSSITPRFANLQTLFFEQHMNLTKLEAAVSYYLFILASNTGYINKWIVTYFIYLLFSTFTWLMYIWWNLKKMCEWYCLVVMFSYG